MDDCHSSVHVYSFLHYIFVLGGPTVRGQSVCMLLCLIASEYSVLCGTSCIHGWMVQ